MSGGRAIGLSLLDRLMADEGSLVSRIRDGLRRDLEDLLNTNERVRGWPADLKGLDDSVFGYGIVDLSTANLATEQRRAAVVARIGEAIARMEPRLTALTVAALPNVDPADRTLRFRITAQIMVESEQHPIIFNTVIDPLNNNVSLRSVAS